MREFKCRCRDKYKIPIAYNSEIIAYAEEVARDYKPANLKEPKAVNGIHFLESYLGLVVDFQDIYYEAGEEAIVGATIFYDDYVRVFDRENLCSKPIAVNENTVLMDNSILVKGKENFANFTALHEGGHYCFHREHYYQNKPKAGQGLGTQCCRRSSMTQSHTRYLSPQQMLEHQASLFAAFLAMPRTTFIPTAKEIIADIGFKKGILVYDDCGGWEDDFYIEKVTRQLSKIYGVSPTAAKVHLKATGLLQTKADYTQRIYCRA